MIFSQLFIWEVFKRSIQKRKEGTGFLRTSKPPNTRLPRERILCSIHISSTVIQSPIVSIFEHISSSILPLESSIYVHGKSSKVRYVPWKTRVNLEIFGVILPDFGTLQKVEIVIFSELESGIYVIREAFPVADAFRV